VYRITRCGDIAIRVSWGIWNPILGEGEVVGSQRWRHLKERWWFPIGSPLWPLGNLYPICDRKSPTLKSTGGGSLWAQISGCSPWSKSMMFGSAESKRPTLTNREIIFEEFQPVWSQSTNVTDRQTDRQTTCDRKTALCTKVHRAVKTNWTLRTHVRWCYINEYCKCCVIATTLKFYRKNFIEYIYQEK